MGHLTRSATAAWKGNGLEGQGSLTTQSGAFQAQPYSVRTRFSSEDGKAGTNPEELIAAAHAGCFAMALSFALTGAGHEPERLGVDATVKMESEGVHWSITGIVLDLEARAPGLDLAKLTELAEGVKKGCPVSKALAAVPIELKVRLG